ncbi:MAG: hypothetical protein HQ464_14585 [Planctomycetes bacterium]|nr:hypothetical protein [Planctomycetota bacterium]
MNLSLVRSPRRLFQRIAFWWYRRSNPGIPLLAIQAVEFLGDYLRPTDILLEYGSGHSTRWYAGKCGHVTAVENIPEWAEIVRREIASCDNVTLRVFPGFDPVQTGGGGFGAHSDRPYEGLQSSAAYAAFIDTFPDGHFDVIVNDGWCRHQIGARSLTKLRPGGIMIWDDVHWSELTNSPTPEIRRFVETVSPWRRVSFSDGVHRTTLLFSPGP